MLSGRREAGWGATAFILFPNVSSWLLVLLVAVLGGRDSMKDLLVAGFISVLVLILASLAVSSPALTESEASHGDGGSRAASRKTALKKGAFSKRTYESTLSSLTAVA